MKQTSTHEPAIQGVTLVELLVVISIISVLAGLLLPVMGKVIIKRKVTEATKDIGDIRGGIAAYKADYSRMPVSTAAQNAANGAPFSSGGDFVFGTHGVLGYSGVGVATNNLPSGYEANNSELMLVLTASEQFPSSTNTVNSGHAKNVRKTLFLNAKQVSGTQPGLGPDGVFRDPFLQPYIITLDLNYDDFVAPGIYRYQSVSQQAGTTGYYGLLHRDPVNVPLGNSDEYGLRSDVAIWSVGPDGKFHQSIRADSEGAISGQKVINSDNILSWK
ncbi:MAG: type II secretion system protein [Limisphaerales bacterium]